MPTRPRPNVRCSLVEVRMLVAVEVVVQLSKFFSFSNFLSEGQVGTTDPRYEEWRSIDPIGYESSRLRRKAGKLFDTAFAGTAIYYGGKGLYKAAMRLRSGRNFAFKSRAARRTFVRSRRLPGRFTTAPLLSSGRSSFGQNRTSGIGVTGQYDRKQVYRKRFMPRRKKRIWKRFTRKVHAVAEKELGSRTVVFNKTQTGTNNTSGNHIWMNVALYPQASTTSYLNDLENISGLETQQPTNAPTVDYNVDASTRMLFQSGILDLTVRNTTTILSGGQQVASSEGRLEVDVYEVTSKRFFVDSGTEIFNSMFDIFNDASSDVQSIPSAPAGISPLTRGATPFDIPQALSRWGIRIWKKQKYLLNNGEAFTYQIRDPKRHSVNHEKMKQTNGANFPGLTRWLIIIAKLVPGGVVGTESGQFTESLSLGITRKYLYKVEGLNADGDAYFADT